jgi:thiamine biosynthesis lipoprotein ApbE
MTPADLMSLVGVTAGVGALLSALAAWSEARMRRRSRASGERVQERVDRLTGTLRDAMSALATTSEELQQEVDQGQQLVARLQADARTYEELARVNRTQAEAVATLVRGELATEGRRSFWKGFAMNLGFFVAGVVVSVVIAAVFGS